MTLQELVCYVRDDLLRDSRAPALWTDNFIVLQLKEAENIFARRTHVLTSDDELFSTLTTAQGVSRYPLDRRVVFVQDIEDADGIPLLSRSRNRVPHHLAEGKPRLFTTDAGHRTLRLYPTPDGVHVLTMLVAHLPVRALTSTAPQRTPEIPEEYHLNLAQYAAYKALVNNGPEGADTESAESFRLLWEEALREAKRDVYQFRGRPNARVVNNWTLGRR